MDGTQNPKTQRSARRAASVVGTRPADEVSGVTTSEGYGPPLAQRSPCGGDQPRPWRRDAPAGQFPAEAFRLSAHTSYDQSEAVFGCHGADPRQPRVCAGFLLRGAGDNLAVRGWLTRGSLSVAVLPDGVELYDSYREMALANGVDRDDPALAPCRGDGVDFR